MYWNITVNNSFHKTCLEYMDKCETFGKFSTDIELINSRRSITCFSLSCENSSGICIPLIDELGQAMWTEKEEYAIWDRYGRLIENENISKCNQNIAFDATEITRLLGFIFKGPIQCTMTGFSILYPNFPADLGFISSIYTDIPYFKADSGKVWLNKTLKIDNYKEFLRYNALDAIAAFEAWHGNDWTNGIEQDLKDQDFWRTYELTMEPFEALTYMMNRGIRVDQKAIESLDNEVSNTIRSLRKRLCDIIGKDFNPSSPKQCLEYFYERCQIQPYKNIKTGKPSTDDKALSRIARRDLGDPSEVAKTIMQIRTLEKQKKSYLDCQWSEDGRIRCSWKARGTIFGRFASSKTIYNEGLNFQNLDPEFAGFLVAD